VWLAACGLSFLAWLANSNALSNTIRSVARLAGKLAGR
jgi:hypothetical protein